MANRGGSLQELFLVGQGSRMERLGFQAEISAHSWRFKWTRKWQLTWKQEGLQELCRD